MFKSGSKFLSQKLTKLTLRGGIVFWVVSIVTSLLPIAAEYRDSFTNRSWNMQTVWAGSLLAGMIIACGVSYSMLRWIENNPTKNPVQISMLLSFVALAVVTILMDIPRSFLSPGSRDAGHYFLIGILLNALRFSTLGIAIGNQYKRLEESASDKNIVAKPV